MKNNFFVFLLFCLVSSCNDSKVEADGEFTTSQVDKEIDSTPFVTQTEKVTDSVSVSMEVNKEDVSRFFNLSNNSEKTNQLLFFDKKKLDPVRWISIEEYELQRSTLINQNSFSVLVLDNPAESSTDLFYKQNGKKVEKMIEDKHFPDNVVFHHLNDTLLICQYYWEYDFGSDLSDIRKYYFIGEKTGFFEYGYSTTGIKLNLDDFVSKGEGVSFEDNENGISLLVLPDTIYQLMKPKKPKKVSVFKPYFIHFENVTFSE